MKKISILLAILLLPLSVHADRIVGFAVDVPDCDCDGNMQQIQSIELLDVNNVVLQTIDVSTSNGQTVDFACQVADGDQQVRARTVNASGQTSDDCSVTEYIVIPASAGCKPSPNLRMK